MNSIRTAVILAAFLTTACSAGTVSPSAAASSPPSATASSTVAPTATPADAFQGTWTTAEVTCDQQVAAIHMAGFTDAQITASGFVCSQPGYYSLRFLADQLAQFSKSSEGAWELGSGGSYTRADDHTIVETDAADQSLTTLSFTLVGNVLTFLSASTTSDLGAQIAIAAIYLTAPFTREP